MQKRDLRDHKDALKQLTVIPAFKTQARNKLPAPFKKLGGPRIQTTGILSVSPHHSVFFYWRDGPVLSDRLFMGYFFAVLAKGDLSPIFEFHWHPSHKGFHCKTPCNTSSNYTNRMLPGAPELAIKTDPNLDPKSGADREKLIRIFCKACGIELPKAAPETLPLWSPSKT